MLILDQYEQVNIPGRRSDRSRHLSKLLLIWAGMKVTTQCCLNSRILSAVLCILVKKCFSLCNRTHYIHLSMKHCASYVRYKTVRVVAVMITVFCNVMSQFGKRTPPIQMLMHTHASKFSWCLVGWSNVRFLQHSCWQHGSPEMWWCATGWVAPLCCDGLSCPHVHGKATFLECFTAHPEADCHIPENLHLLPDILIFIFKPRTIHYSLLHTSSSYNFITSFLLKRLV